MWIELFSALWLLWAALLFGGYIFGKGGADGRRMPTWTRLASSLVLMIAAWSGFAMIAGTMTGPFALLMALGMTLGSVGDLFMAGLLLKHGSVLAGMATFGLGHVCYIAASLWIGAQMHRYGPVYDPIRIGAWLAWLLIGLLGWYLVVYRGQRATVLHWVALPYALLLASTAGVATGLALADGLPFVLFAVGAALFLFSELMIAAKLFAGRSLRRINMDDLIWLTYGPGQMLIVYTSVLIGVFAAAFARW